MKLETKKTPILQHHLINIAENVTNNTTIEDVFEQLLMLNDIDESEKQIKEGLVYTNKQVKEEAKTWLK